MSFNNKVVIVTGSGTGIGAATAIAFAKEGAKVALAGIVEADLNNVAKQCSAVGSTPLVIKADVSNDDDAKRIINDTVQKFGKLDVLVNNAAVMLFADILSGKVLEAYDKLIPINLRAVIHLTMLAAPHLVKTKGNIVNISSHAGHKCTAPAVITYSVAKAGLNHFTKGSALELAPHGVRVNAISPGPVQTQFLTGYAVHVGATAKQLEVQTPLKRGSPPEEMADLILFLAGEKAKGVTGSIYSADNGCGLR